MLSVLKKLKYLLIRFKSKCRAYWHYFCGYLLFLKSCHQQTQIPSTTYSDEVHKYLNQIKTDSRENQVFLQLQAFLKSSFELKSDLLVLSDNSSNPIVVVVVKNELKRMKAFFQHYRKLGVNQFVVLDNGSNDGTLEYLMEQDGTRVFQILEGFQTQKKEAWIEKLLVMTGFDHWYIVVDSDELLDYIGSESHSIQELINRSIKNGYKRIWGYMLDMYSRESLFLQSSEETRFADHYRFFDKVGYAFKIYDENKCRGLYDRVSGGPRNRLFNQTMVLSKQAVFFFEKNMIYRNCHYLYPIVKLSDIPCFYVLRHYKFMPDDKKEYIRRIKSGSFNNNSEEYKNIMKRIEANNEISMFYDGSEEYINSDSLTCLPILEKIDW